jgi:integrase
MPYIRKLKSGKWQATVRHPSGKRITKTDPLRRVVADWARDLEAQYARGELRDPRAGRITVGEWRQRWQDARAIEPVTAAKHESLWRVHCEPKWSDWPMDAVTRTDAEEWTKSLIKTKNAKNPEKTLSPASVTAIVHLMSGLFAAAVAERPPIVVANPFHDLRSLPTIPPSPIKFFTHDEAERLVESFDEPLWRVLIELGLWSGLRPGELFGLYGDRVDWLRGSVHVTRVMTRNGIREYPKSARSRRHVPVRDETMERWKPLMAGRSLDGPIFTMPEGGLIDDSNFRHRIWTPAIERAGVRKYSPRIMRHTAASWLVQDGVDLYRVQALLGHESFATTQRYAHLAPDAHDKIHESWRRMGDARRDEIKKKGRGA